MVEPAKEILGLTGEPPVLLWCEEREDGLELWGQWDEACNVWWIYFDQACTNFFTDAEDISDIDEYGPEWAEQRRNGDPGFD